LQTHWRLAFMFDAPDRSLPPFEQALLKAQSEIRANAAGHGVRIGVADRPVDQEAGKQAGSGTGPGEVDGAIEISIANESIADAPGICMALSPLLASLAEPGTLQVMTGPMFHMVPVRSGQCFLSLSFRRDPTTSSPQFQDWWYNQHSKLAIPVLGEGLLAYDQVHVDAQASRQAAEALGVPYVEYDAYDNLTWADLAAYQHSISEPIGMARVFADEVGRIDRSSMRHAMMRDIG
jgi:hypothetical protein